MKHYEVVGNERCKTGGQHETCIAAVLRATSTRIAGAFEARLAQFPVRGNSESTSFFDGKHDLSEPCFEYCLSNWKPNSERSLAAGTV